MMHWYVIYTQARAEKKTADRLAASGFEVYCPLREEVRQWSDRRKKVKVPVFRSYVFVRLANYNKENVAVLQTPGVARFLWWLGKPAIVRDAEMDSLQQFLEEYRKADIRVTYQKGEKVAIKEGPLKEYKGVIIDLDKRKAVLYVESLGLTLKAQLPLGMIGKLEC